MNACFFCWKLSRLLVKNIKLVQAYKFRNTFVCNIALYVFISLLQKSVFQLDDSSDEEVSTVSAKPRPRRSLGMGYILEDAQWLDNELE